LAPSPGKPAFLSHRMVVQFLVQERRCESTATVAEGEEGIWTKAESSSGVS